LDKEALLKNNKRLLDESLRFRDAVFEKAMPEVSKMKKSG